MGKANISLNEMLVALGYDRVTYSQWVQNILQVREDFRRLFVATPRTSKRDRASHTLVSEDARTLIDNLCILKPYMSMFGQNPSKTELQVYQRLLHPDPKDDYHKEGIKTRKRLVAYKEFNDKALASLDKFMALVCRGRKIDITKDSLRKLMSEFVQVGDTGELAATSALHEFDPAENACWHTIIEMQEKLDEHPDDSSTHLRLAESWYALNQQDECLEELDTCLGIHPADGVAWALKAKVLFERLESEKQLFKPVFAEPDRSPYVSSLNRSEVDRMFMRDAWGREANQELREGFVDAALEALKYWPSEDPWDDAGNLAFSTIGHGVNVEIDRDWLFYQLVMNLMRADADRAAFSKTTFMEILSTFKSDENVKSFPVLRLRSCQGENLDTVAFLQKLTLLMKDYSAEGYRSLLEAFVSDFEETRWHARENLLELTNSPLAPELWNYLGAKKYARLYDRLLAYQAEFEGENRISHISCKLYTSIDDMLREPLRLYVANKFKEDSGQFYEKMKDAMPQGLIVSGITPQMVRESFSQKLVEIHEHCHSYDALIREHVPSDICLLKERRTGVYPRLVPLVELVKYNLTGDQHALATLDALAASRECMNYFLDDNEYYLIQMFDVFWEHENMDPGLKKPESFFKEAHAVCTEAGSLKMILDGDDC